MTGPAACPDSHGAYPRSHRRVGSLPVYNDVMNLPLPSRRFAVACLLAGAALGCRPAVAQQVILPRGFGPPAALGTRPSPAYDAALAALASGATSRA